MFYNQRKTWHDVAKLNIFFHNQMYSPVVSCELPQDPWINVGVQVRWCGQLRCVSSTMNSALTSDQFYFRFTAAHSRLPYAHELPLSAVETMLDPHEIRADLSYPRIPIKIADFAVERFAYYIHWEHFVQNHIWSVGVFNKFSRNSNFVMSFGSPKPRTQYTPTEILESKNTVISWGYIIATEKLPVHILQKLLDKDIYQNEIVQYQTLSERFITRNLPKLSIDTLYRHQRLSEQFMEWHIATNPAVIPWKKVSRYQILSERFMRKHSADLNWEAISSRQLFSEEFAIDFQAELDWESVCNYGAFRHLEKFAPISQRLNWETLCINHTLSTEFIEKYHDIFDFDWRVISSKCALNVEFLEKFKDKINWVELLQNKNTTLSRDDKIRFVDYFGRSNDV